MTQTMTADPDDRTDRRSFRDWQGWYYVPGIAFVIVGILALAEPPIASLAAVIYIGVKLCVAGAFMTMGGVANLAHRGGWIALILGLLSIVTGLLILGNPVAGAVSVVWLLGFWLIASGISELLVGLKIPHGRMSLIFVSLINIALGVLALMMRPAAAFAFLGFFFGLSLLFQGLWSLTFMRGLHRAKGLSPATES